MRRKTDLVRIAVFLCGILAIFLSWAVILHAQNNDRIEQQFRDINQQQKLDQEKVNNIDKRLIVIESKQDFITQLIYGIGAAIGLMLADRVRALLFAPRRRQYDDEESS